jgi:hypothetical protein
MAVAQKVPVAPIGLACAMAVAFVLRRIRVAWVMFAAMLAFLAGTLLLTTAPVGQSYWINTFLSIIIMPLAMNWSYPAGSVILSNAVPRESQGIAASLISTMVNYSISLGLGVSGSIMWKRIRGLWRRGGLGCGLGLRWMWLGWLSVGFSFGRLGRGGFGRFGDEARGYGGRYSFMFSLCRTTAHYKVSYFPSEL